MSPTQDNKQFDKKLFNARSLIAHFFNDAAVPPHLAGEFRAGQIDAIVNTTPAMLAITTLNILVATYATYLSGNWIGTILWCSVMMAFTAYLSWKRWKSHGRPKPQTASPHALHTVIKNGFIFGLLWACVPLFFYVGNTISGQILVICLCAGMLSGGVFVLAPVPAAATVFMIPLALASIVAAIRNGQAHDIAITALVIIFASALLRSVFNYHAQLVRKTVERSEAEVTARKDPLTGLINRVGFEEFITDHAIAPMKRHGTHFAVMYMDLDHFKIINDTHGHAGGDDLLREVAARLTSAVRPGDCVARLGGDEFGIVVRDCGTAAMVAAIADRILRAFGPPFYVSGRPVNCQTSIGIAMVPHDGEDAANIIKSADVALYQAKANRRGAYCFLEDEIQERLLRRRCMARTLSRAIRKNQFYLEFQPIYSTEDRQITAFEALIRWQHPDLGLISPGEFIPVAEELGLIQDIGEWIIRHACDALAAMPAHVRICVNFSPRQLRSPTLLAYTLNCLASRGIVTERFEIEITETVSIEGDTDALGVLESFRDAGISIALDDFGTGFSSLSYVCKLPISRVKIDRSFVASLFGSPQSMAVVQAIIGLAHNLGMKVVAEGVESRAQFDVVAGHGCEEIQGFLLSRPLSQRDAVALANNADEKILVLAA